MISESDIKALRTSSSRLYRVVLLTVFPLGIGLLLVGGVAHFLWSARLAESDGVTVRKVIGVFFSDIDVSQQYSGVFVKALDEFSTGFFEVGAAIIYAAMMAFAWKLRKRNIRILNFIDEKLPPTPRG